MSDHYYSERPQVKRSRTLIHAHLRGLDMAFWTDRGVFSRDAIDYGTQLLLETIEITENAHVLDLGCGYGPIGLTLAKENPKRQVTCVDVNERAVELTTLNAEKNDVENARVLQSDGYAALDDHDRFQVIVSNPPIRAGKDLVHTFIKEAPSYLVAGGQWWMVIRNKQGAQSAKKILQTYYADVTDVARKKGYRILRATNRGSIE